MPSRLPARSTHRKPDQVGVVELVGVLGRRQPLARHVELDVGKPLGGIAVANAREPRNEMILGGPQRLDLEDAAVLGFSGP